MTPDSRPSSAPRRPSASVCRHNRRAHGRCRSGHRVALVQEDGRKRGWSIGRRSATGSRKIRRSGSRCAAWRASCSGIGAGGAGWLARLARSRWFAGLEPRAEDFAAGDIPCGNWTVSVRDDGGVATEAESFFAPAALPDAWYAAVAVPRRAGPAELSATLGLIGALRARRDPCGRRLTVVVTVEAPQPPAGPFERQLLERGAFVVRAGMGEAGDHLHHFPLRAPTAPRRGRLGRGRLVCVDLADYLHTWRPGRVADLHVIPSGFEAAARALRGVPVSVGGICALNLGLHLDLDAPGNPLLGIDRLATHCRNVFLGPAGDMLFTDTERLDGEIGSADLLVVHESNR